jgi:hypothetical protein
MAKPPHFKSFKDRPAIILPGGGCKATRAAAFADWR